MIVKRRLEHRCQNKSHVVSEDQIKYITGPVAIIGEPGSGKTTLAKILAENLSGQYLSVSDLRIKDENDLTPGRCIIVDGLDEVSRGSQQDILDRIIRILPMTSQCIFTCRTADWKVSGAKLIQSKFQQKPEELILLPFNQQEIFEFIKIKIGKKNARRLITKASEDSIYDLLSNPLMANLLIDLWSKKKWPETKYDLFDKGTHFLASENNEIHQEYLGRSISIDMIVEGAGYIFSLMLLADISHISLSGDQLSDPYISNFSQNEIPIQEIISTKLFRPLGHSQIVPFHRSIAEYLAAKWIAAKLNINEISLRRLESALYGHDYNVPSELRGLHAWLACLVTKKNKLFIERDPYGIFRYGDATLLDDVEDSRILLRGLCKAAEHDPYISAGDYMTIGRGIARRDLKKEILEILRCENPILIELVIRSLIGFPLVDEISSDLENYLFNTSNDSIGRRAVFTAIVSSENFCREDIVGRLSRMDDEDSLRIALDEGCREYVELFEGAFLGNLIYRWHTISNTEGGSKILGVGYYLHNSMSEKQIYDAIDNILISRITLTESNDAAEALNNQLAIFLNELGRRKYWPDATLIWRVLQSMSTFRMNSLSLQGEDALFNDLPQDRRQEIQRMALNDLPDEDTHRSTISYLNEIGLGISEIDAKHLIEYAMSNQSMNKQSLVRVLVPCFINSDSILESARSLSQETPDLLEFIDNIIQPQEEPEWMIQHKTMQMSVKKKHDDEIRRRHDDYEAHQEDIANGNHIQAAYYISNAYLGLCFGSIMNPEDRIVKLAGEKILPIAISAISNTVHNQKIPSAREITELDAREKKTYHVMTVCIAYCDIEIKEKGELSSISEEIILSTLAACNLYGNHVIIDKIKRNLHKSISGKNDIIEKYARDTIEPYLEMNTEEYISCLDQLRYEPVFFSVAGKLAIEWLIKFSNLSSGNLKMLCDIAARYRSENLIPILIDRLNRQPSENVKDILMRFAFFLDFDRHRENLQKYASDHRDTIWTFRRDGFSKEYYPDSLSPEQLYFLLENYIYEWPEIDSPEGIIRDRDPYNAAWQIREWIDALANDLSDESVDILNKICNEKKDSSYIFIIKNLREQQRIKHISERKEYYSIKEIKSILTKSRPESIKDLQVLILDALDDAQDKIRGSITNQIDLFWCLEGKPQDENFCRDRLMEIIREYFEYPKIKILKESASVKEKRVDIKVYLDKLIVPIEIKGQWHRDIWSAAESQLHAYASEYGADGYGIYLVLWFGKTKYRKSLGWEGQPAPKSKEEMERLLDEKYDGISSKTKFFVIDLSRD